MKNLELREDLYDKMMSLDAAEPTPEEHHRKAVTKLRYMQVAAGRRLRLKTHGVENRRWFSTSKIGVDFRLRKQTWPKKVTTMLLLLQLCIHIVVKCNKYKTKCNRNVYLPILHCYKQTKRKQ